EKVLNAIAADLQSDCFATVRRDLQVSVRGFGGQRLHSDLHLGDYVPFIWRLSLFGEMVVSKEREPDSQARFRVHLLDFMLPRFKYHTSHISGLRDLQGASFRLQRLLRCSGGGGAIGIRSSCECEDDSGYSSKQVRAA